MVLSVSPTVRLSAQGVFNQFSYENLKPSAIQLDLGPLGGNNVRGTLTGGMRLDYGFIAPRVRVLLGASYFRADFSSAARQRFEQRIRSVVTDPSRDDTISLGRMTWSDVTGDLDLQYVLPQGHAVTTYLGVGVGVHIRHGGGSAINGPFLGSLGAGAAVISIVAHFAVGAAKTFVTGRNPVASGMEMTIVGSVEGLITYLIGLSLGGLGGG